MFFTIAFKVWTHGLLNTMCINYPPLKENNMAQVKSSVPHKCCVQEGKCNLRRPEPCAYSNIVLLPANRIQSVVGKNHEMSPTEGTEYSCHHKFYIGFLHYSPNFTAKHFNKLARFHHLHGWEKTVMKWKADLGFKICIHWPSGICRLPWLILQDFNFNLRLRQITDSFTCL